MEQKPYLSLDWLMDNLSEEEINILKAYKQYFELSSLSQAYYKKEELEENLRQAKINSRNLRKSIRRLKKNELSENVNALLENCYEELKESVAIEQNIFKQECKIQSTLRKMQKNKTQKH